MAGNRIGSTVAYIALRITVESEPPPDDEYLAYQLIQIFMRVK